MFEVGREFFIFIYAVLAGMFLMLSYKFLQLMRCLIPHKPQIVNMEDLLFWVFTSFYLFQKMYRTTNGSVRWFFVIGIILGAEIIWYCCFKGRRHIRDKINLEKGNETR